MFEQIAVAGHDEIGLCRYRTSQYLIIIRILGNRWRNADGVHHGNLTGVLGEKLGNTRLNGYKTRSEFLSGQDIFEFGEQGATSKEMALTGNGNIEYLTGCSAPEKRRHHAIGVEDQPHQLRCRRSRRAALISDWISSGVKRGSTADN